MAGLLELQISPAFRLVLVCVLRRHHESHPVEMETKRFVVEKTEWLVAVEK